MTRWVSMVLAALLLLLVAWPTPAVQQVQGEGRALVLDGDEAQARHEALATALEDAALRAGATVQASSVLDASGALHEQTLVRAEHHVLGYEVLEEHVDDALVTTRITALVGDQENRACDGAALGGRIEVDAASRYVGLPGEARNIRTVSAFQDGFSRHVVATLNDAQWPAAVEFAIIAPQGYERLTRRATTAAPLRGVLNIVATIRAAPPADAERRGTRFIAALKAEFHDALSGARTALGEFDQVLPDGAGADQRATLSGDALQALKKVSSAVLRGPAAAAPPASTNGGLPALARAMAALICAPAAIPLQRAGAAFSVAIGAAHGIDAGALFRAETAGGTVYLRAARVAQGSTQLTVIGKDTLPLEVSEVELLGNAH